MLNMLNRVLSSNIGDDYNVYAPKRNFELGLGATALIAGIGAAANTAGSVMSANAAAGTSHAARSWQHSERLESQAWQEAMQELQYQRTIEQYNMMNEYESPVNQVQRLIEAGINPNNVGAMVSGNHNGMSSPSAPGAVSAPSAAMAFSPFDTGLNPVSLEQLGIMRAQEENIDANTKLVKSQTEGQDLSNSVYLSDKNAEWAYKHAMVEFYDKQTELTEEQRAAAQYQREQIMPLIKKNTAEEFNNLIKAGRVMDEQVKTEKAKQAEARSAVLKNNAEAGYLGELQNNEAKKGKVLDAEVVVANNRERIAKQYGVDVNDLDEYEKVNMQLRSKGYTDDQIDDFWDQLQVSYGTAAEREVKHGGPVSTGLQIGKTASEMYGARTARGVAKSRNATRTQSVTGTQWNPQTKKFEPMQKKIVTRFGE